MGGGGSGGQRKIKLHVFLQILTVFQRSAVCQIAGRAGEEKGEQDEKWEGMCKQNRWSLKHGKVCKVGQ